MRKLLALFVMIAFVCSPVYGYQKKGKDSEANSSSYSKSGASAIQGQAAINKAVGSGNEVDISNSESEETDVLAPTWAPTPSTQGKEEAKVYSLFGGLDQNEISRDVRVDHQIKTLKLLKEEGIIDEDVYSSEMLKIYTQLESENKTAKVVGLIPFGCKNPILKLIACF